MLPHIKRPTTTASLDFQVRQSKKKWLRRKWSPKATIKRICRPLPIFLCILTSVLFAAMGSFYGVMINSMDLGNASHQLGGGFWRKENNRLEQKLASRITQRGALEIAPNGSLVMPTHQLQTKLGALHNKFASIRNKAEHDSEAENTRGSAPEAVRRASAPLAFRASKPQAQGSIGQNIAQGQGPRSEAGVEFVCDGGRKRINTGKVNDDYCDCEDGSDELKTSACADTMFECTADPIDARRFFSVPSSRVNDGVCDCCDGQDELANPSLQCPNRCAKPVLERRGLGGRTGARWEGRKASVSLFESEAGKRRPH